MVSSVHGCLSLKLRLRLVPFLSAQVAAFSADLHSPAGLYHTGVS